MARSLSGYSPRHLRAVRTTDRPATLAEVGDPAGALVDALRAEVEAALGRSLITRGEADELLARITIVVDQAVRDR